MSDQPIDWPKVARELGIPWGWALRPKDRGDFWVLTATGPRVHATGGVLPCGHRSMQARATNLPLAVARITRSLDFHRRHCR